VSRWLFKMNRQYDGRGIAYVDIARHLTCYSWCVREARRRGPDEWRDKSTQVSYYYCFILSQKIRCKYAVM